MVSFSPALRILFIRSMAPSDGRRRSSEPVVNGYNINPTPGSPTLLQNPSHLTVRVRSQRRVEPLPDPPRRSLTPSGSSAQSSVVRKLLSLVEPYQPGDSAVLENRRLLPNSKNALHIIDGEDTRYYIGIIDFLTKYRFRQRAGKVIKDMRFCCGDHSTRGPQVYADRFLHFIYDHTSWQRLTYADIWSRLLGLLFQTEVKKRLCNDMHIKQWDVITHPCRNFNGGLATAWMSNYISHKIMDIIYIYIV